MNKNKVGIITGLAVVVIAIILVVIFVCSNSQPSSNKGSVPIQTNEATQSETIDISINDITNPVPATEEATEEGTYDKTADVKLEIIDGRNNSDVPNNNNNSNISASRVK